MYKDKGLIPFLGGLIVGGVGGAAFDNRFSTYPQYYQPYYHYPNYNYYPPIINQHQYPYYNNLYPSAMNVASNVSQNMMVEDNRYYSDLSFVPIYKQ